MQKNIRHLMQFKKLMPFFMQEETYYIEIYIINFRIVGITNTNLNYYNKFQILKYIFFLILINLILIQLNLNIFRNFNRFNLLPTKFRPTKMTVARGLLVDGFFQI